MKDYQNTNFSLLSQEEIDVLVNFLTNNAFVESDVLSQESIDRLVSLLLRDSGERIHMELLDPITKPLRDILQDIGLRSEVGELCELEFEIGEDDFLKLFASNKKTGKRMEITPQTFDNEEPGTKWGKSMSPVNFNRLARVLDAKYAAETYDEICHIFAEHTFGDKDAHLPAIYFPTNEHLIRTLL